MVCSVRHTTTTLPSDVPILLDTGADTTTLPFSLASLLGFSTSDLQSQDTNAVGGKAKVYKLKVSSKVEVRLGGTWYALPNVVFAENTPPLFGRDFIFANFKVRMEHGETELRPK